MARNIEMRGYVCPNCGDGEYSLEADAPYASVLTINPAQVELECSECGHVWVTARDEDYEQVIRMDV